ncbi:hypothetical protein JW711_03275 [Candidatus Woesearchaeota archaeon]|nr:hypothetical protein [Candidatus Woesearchaeota archaeon]
MKTIAEELKEDLKFSRKVEKAWQEVDKGKTKKLSDKAFLDFYHKDE